MSKIIKKIRDIILILLVVLLGFLASIFTAIRDQSVQNFIARTAAGFLSEKTGTDVQIGSFFFDHKLSLHLKNVKVFDIQKNQLIAADNIGVQLLWTNLSKELHVKSVDLDNISFELIKYENDEKINIFQLTQMFSTEKDTSAKEKSTYVIKVDDIDMKNSRFRYWNQNKDIPDKGSMDYAHLYIKNINLSANNFKFANDTISIKINKLTGIDTCGIVLEKMTSEISVSPQHIHCKDLTIITPKSSLRLDLQFIYNNYPDFLTFIDSVRIKASIDPSSLYLADIGYFAKTMYSMTNTVSVSGDFDGLVKDFQTSNFSFSFGKETIFHGDIHIKGLPDFFSSDIDLKINKMTTSFADLQQFALPIKSQYLAFPKQLESFGKTSLNGYFSGHYNDFLAQALIKSEIGEIKTDLFMNSNSKSGLISYEGRLETNQLQIGKIAELDQKMGGIDMDVKVKGSGLTKNTVNLDVDGRIHSIDILDNVFEDIMLFGNIADQLFNGNLVVDDPKLKLDFDGKIDFSEKIPILDFTADIQHADLFKINLLTSDSTMVLRTKIRTNMRGFTLDEIVGRLQIDSTYYADSKHLYFMKQFKMDVTQDQILKRKIEITNDFFTFNMSGKIDFSAFGESFKSYIGNYVQIPEFCQKTEIKSNQEFYVELTLNNPEPLTNIFMPSLKIANNTTYSGSFTSRNQAFRSTFRSSQILFGDVRFENVVLRTNSNFNKATANLFIRDLILRDSTSLDSTIIGIERSFFNLNLQNDSILLNVSWRDGLVTNRNKGNIQTLFIPDTVYGGTFRIKSADVLVNDSSWSVNSENFVRFERNMTTIQNMDIMLGKQFLSLNGHIPFEKSDTLSVNFNHWNISNFDVILHGYGINLDGNIDGDLQIANLKNSPTFFSNLTLSSLAMNNEMLGDAHILSSWNNTDQSIYLNTQILNVGNISTQKTLNLTGFYFPMKKKNSLKFELKLNNFKLKPIAPFVETILSDFEGLASGDFNIIGTLDKPEILGKLNLFRTGFRINYLNTYYSLQHSFDFEKNKISFDKLVLFDTIGNKAEMSGNISHNYLNDFTFNVQLTPQNFLALNTTRELNNLFYGSAIVTGKVNIKGPLDNINLSIDATTNEGTDMYIPLDNSSTVGENDFVVFVSEDEEQDSVVVSYTRIKPAKNFNIDINTNINPNAKVMIILPSNMGNLEAKGSGNLRIGSGSGGEFTLLGDYVIQNGEFNFVYENLLKKRFELMNGGKISWTGNPLDANIDVKGKYKVKTSLSSLGISADTTSSLSSRVNVECIIHLTNQLFNPDISFSIQIPNIDSETQQQVYAVLDTNNQAVMTQQIISLLVLGSFSHTGGSNASLGSSYFNVISNQLSNWLSQISKDFDIGLTYKPGDELSNDELEVALSTQLFNDRVTIEGNFGVVNNRNTTQNASNIVGDVDISVKITRDGRLSAKAFNHSNINSSYYNYTFDDLSPYTQGIGLQYRQNFDRFKEIFERKNKKKKPAETKD